jgi:membrane fusion protein (multidrug efflux system)
VIFYRNGIAKFETILTGIRDSTYIQVTDGVKLGDTVLTTALLALQPDSKVSLTKVQ